MPRADAVRAPVAGERLGSHLLVEEVGRGGMGVVFRAIEEGLGRTVALKVLAAERLAHRDARRRFEREAAAAAMIAHPNVLPVYRVDEDRGHMFITMQYVPGGSLSDVIAEQGPAPVHVAVDIIGQVARGLDAAHGAGLVHRDVKPQNILMEPGGHVWLTDFGTVRATADLASSLTRSGQLVGTLDYMSPEQIRGDPVGPQADVYGLACVAYRLLVGRVPFPREDPVARIYAHLSDAPPDARAHRAGVPAGVSEAIARAMAKDPSDRPRSAGEFANALHDASRGAGSPGPADATIPWGPVAHEGETTESPMPRRPGRARAGAALAGAIVLGTVLGAGSALALGALTSAPPAAAGGASVDDPPPGLQVAALGPVRWPDLLPSTWRAGERPPRATRVSDGVPAVLWTGVATAQGRRADVVLVPTDAGVLGATCTPPSDACLAAAASMSVGAGAGAIPITPSPVFAQGVSRAGAEARAALAAGQAAIGGARSSAGQAAAARALARRIARARSLVGPAQPGLGAARSRLLQDLTGMSAAANALGEAARRGDQAAWARAARDLATTASAFNRHVSGLASLGYRVRP